MRFPSPILLCLMIVGIALPGCRTRDFRTEGDVLRARIMDMDREITELERRNAELRAELQRRARTEAIADDVMAETPQVVELTFARFSHARDTTGDGLPDQIRLYLQPRDGRGRFVQAVGELTVSAMLLPREAEPLTIGRMTLGPAELRDAYRSGFMGVYYTATMPVVAPPEIELATPETQEVFVRAVFVDGLTGLTHTAERVLALGPHGRR